MPRNTLGVRGKDTHSYAPELHQVQMPNAHVAMPTPMHVHVL